MKIWSLLKMIKNTFQKSQKLPKGKKEKILKPLAIKQRKIVWSLFWNMLDNGLRKMMSNLETQQLRLGKVWQILKWTGKLQRFMIKYWKIRILFKIKKWLFIRLLLWRYVQCSKSKQSSSKLFFSQTCKNSTLMKFRLQKSHKSSFWHFFAGLKFHVWSKSNLQHRTWFTSKRFFFKNQTWTIWKF